MDAEVLAALRSWLETVAGQVAVGWYGDHPSVLICLLGAYIMASGVCCTAWGIYHFLTTDGWRRDKVVMLLEVGKWQLSEIYANTYGCVFLGVAFFAVGAWLFMPMLLGTASALPTGTW